MVGMDSWCPSCGYSVEPGTRFCNGCGYQFAAAAQSGAALMPSPTVTAQSLPGPFQGSPTQVSAPPPMAGSRSAWPPPPGGGQQPGSPAPRRAAAASEPTAEQAPISDTVERMLRPQGLFQNQQPRPVDWQQNYPPAPGGYPQGGGQYPPGGGQYQGGYQQPGPPQPWPQAPTGALPPAPPGAPAGGYQAGGQYPPGSAPAGGGYQGPYQNGQYGGGQGQYGGYGQGQFPPGVQYGPDGMPLGGGSGPRRGGLPFRLSKGPIIALAAVGVVVIAVVGFMLSSHGKTAANAGASMSASGSPTGTSSASAIAKTQHQAAVALSQLLSQSGGDRTDVGNAYTDVSTCGKDLAKDATVFNKAAANRRTLLAKLAKLPGRSALSQEMLTDLTNAWQASATVDADLAKWADSAAGHCNKKTVTKAKTYTVTLPFDNKATVNKNAFVELWNPLAKKNGLPKVQPSQI